MIRRTVSCVFISAIAAVIMLCFFTASGAQAQSGKPQLAPILLNDDNNDQAVLELARKLNPTFFNIDAKYLDGGKNAKFYARYIDLDPNNLKRFFILTVDETAYYCTTHGCPYYIYENKGDNRWSIVLSAQGYDVFRDTNVTGKPQNIIVKGIEQAQTRLSVFLWNGQSYQKVN